MLPLFVLEHLVEKHCSFCFVISIILLQPSIIMMRKSVFNRWWPDLLCFQKFILAKFSNNQMDEQPDKTQPSESEEDSFSVDENFSSNKTICWLLCCCLSKVEKSTNKIKGSLNSLKVHMNNRHSLKLAFTAL